MFYGCRRSEWDFLYREEWEQHIRELEGKFRMYTAFSREAGKKKTYVQDLLREKADTVVDVVIRKKGKSSLFSILHDDL